MIIYNFFCQFVQIVIVILEDISDRPAPLNLNMKFYQHVKAVNIK